MAIRASMLRRMLNNARRLLVLLALAMPRAGEVAGADSAPVVARCELSGTVDAGSAAYLVDCIDRAQQAGNEALLVQVDTPGGSLESTRIIVAAFLRSRLPILVWVGPAGAHAGSAGVFVTLASHIAAMAPGTNIGAAHPVDLGGGDPESGGKHMAKKIENDTAAFAESIAHKRSLGDAGGSRKRQLDGRQRGESQGRRLSRGQRIGGAQQSRRAQGEHH